MYQPLAHCTEASKNCHSEAVVASPAIARKGRREENKRSTFLAAAPGLRTFVSGPLVRVILLDIFGDVKDMVVLIAIIQPLEQGYEKQVCLARVLGTDLQHNTISRCLSLVLRLWEASSVST